MLIPGVVFIFLESVRQAQYMWFKKNVKVCYYNLQELNRFAIFLVIPLSSVWIYISFSMGLSSVVIRNANSKSPWTTMCVLSYIYLGPLKYITKNSEENWEVSQAWSLHACWTKMLYNDRLETIDNSQSTNSAKTLKIFNVYSSLGL